MPNFFMLNPREADHKQLEELVRKMILRSVVEKKATKTLPKRIR
jgi:hypothetical protein